MAFGFELESVSGRQCDSYSKCVSMYIIYVYIVYTVYILYCIIVYVEIFAVYVILCFFASPSPFAKVKNFGVHDIYIHITGP